MASASSPYILFSSREYKQCRKCKAVFDLWKLNCDHDKQPLSIVKHNDPDPKEPLLATRLNGEIIEYFCTRFIGEGKAVRVYEARHAKENSIVVIAIFRDELIMKEEATESFFAEFSKNFLLNHKNILPLLAMGKAQDQSLACQRPFLVKAHSDGQQLSHLLKENSFLPYFELLQMARQICEALEHAHEKRIWHTQLRPSRIYVERTPQLQVKVGDFQYFYEPMINLAMGLPMRFRSLPVSYLNLRDVYVFKDMVKVDLYSLGSILYECLTGAPPYTDESDLTKPIEPLENFSQKYSGEPIPADFAAIVMKSLDEDRSNRWTSATEMRLEIEKLTKCR